MCMRKRRAPIWREVTAGCKEAERDRTWEESASLWKAWTVHDRPIVQAMSWADDTANFVVKQVALPVTNDPWKSFEASLMVMGCGGGAQRSFFRTFEFHNCGSEQFGTPLIGSDWYDMVSHFIEF